MRGGDQALETGTPCFSAFGADYPPRGEAPITRRLRLEKRPGYRIAPELALVRRGQRRRGAILEGIFSGVALLASREGGDSGGLHTAFVGQDSDARDVHRAPNAFRPSWRETNLVALVIDLLANAVDPAKAERLVDRLRPGDAGSPRIFAIVANPQFISPPRIARQPSAKRARSPKENRRGFIGSGHAGE